MTRAKVNYIRRKFNAVQVLMKSKGKDLIGAIFFFLLILVVASGVARLLNATFVPFLFSQVSSGIVTDIGVILLLLILFVKWSGKILKAYVPSFRITLIISGVVVIYSFREYIFDSSWTYFSFKYFPSFNYLSIIYLLFIGQILFYVNRWSKFYKAIGNGISRFNTWLDKLFKIADSETNEEVKHEGFYCDEPLDEEDEEDEENEDLLGYGTYASRIAENLRKTRSKHSFAVGLNGKWGSGKTSFMNRMKRVMKNKDFILVDFEPWNSQTSQAIVQDFFDTLRNALSPYHGAVGNELELYTEKLISVDDNRFTRSVKNIFYSDNNKGTTEYSKKIEASIRDIGKKIVVFIDDTDRLSKKEIFEVLRLIRNTANFSNTYFVVAYERDYVLSMLDKLHIPGGYFEKIFQVELQLPYHANDHLIKSLASKLSGLSGFAEYKDDITDCLDSNAVVRFGLSHTITTFRDVSRLANSMMQNFSHISDEILMRDCIVIEALRVKYPDVISWVVENSGDLFFREGARNNDQLVRMVLRSAHEKESGNVRNFKESVLFQKLTESKDSYNLHDQKVELISETFHRLFPYYDLFFDERNRGHLTVVNPTRFMLYFQHDMDGSIVPNSQFVNAREAGIDVMNENLKQWVLAGATWEIANRFKYVVHYKDKADFLVIINSQLNAARALLLISRDINWALSSSLRDNLIQKLNKNNDEISKSFFNNTDEYNEFLLDWFRQGLKSDDDVMDDLVTSARKQSTFYYFPLNPETLLSLSLDKLEKYAQRLSNYSPDLWNYFYYTECYKKQYQNEDKSAWYETRYFTGEAKYLMKQILLGRFPLEFLNASIVTDQMNQKGYLIDNAIPSVFGNFKDFHESVKLLDESMEREEYLTFLDKLAVNDYKVAVNSPFFFLKPIAKREGKV